MLFKSSILACFSCPIRSVLLRQVSPWLFITKLQIPSYHPSFPTRADKTPGRRMSCSRPGLVRFSLSINCLLDGIANTFPILLLYYRGKVIALWKTIKEYTRQKKQEKTIHFHFITHISLLITEWKHKEKDAFNPSQFKLPEKLFWETTDYSPSK